VPREKANYLAAVLLRNVNASESLLEDVEPPLGILAAYLQRVLDSEHLLGEIVREADVEWGWLAAALREVGAAAAS
jgi:hypothetical protein